mmetsp:Transcript_34984/g.74401  ORF Transcript_34984/g.74401 Transcript_34984/m.74401 type:complete len:200 (+) Transcript_34984:2503-3102(+)
MELVSITGAMPPIHWHALHPRSDPSTSIAGMLRHLGVLSESIEAFAVAVFGTERIGRTVSNSTAAGARIGTNDRQEYELLVVETRIPGDVHNEGGSLVAVVESAVRETQQRARARAEELLGDDHPAKILLLHDDWLHHRSGFLRQRLWARIRQTLRSGPTLEESGAFQSLRIVDKNAKAISKRSFEVPLLEGNLRQHLR